MNDELRFFLEKGPTSVKELSRLTGRSTSGIYKALKDVPGIITEQKGRETLFSLPPAAAPAGEAPTTPAPKAEPVKGKRGRPALAAGKQLYPSDALLGTVGIGAPMYENPRRKNSHGYKSLQLVIDNPGITTEEFVKLGGRLNDLRWDLDHGNVKAE